MENKESHIQDSISRNLQKWCGIGTVLGALLWVLFTIVDYFREDFLKESYLYRVIIVSVLAAIYFLNNSKRSVRFQHTLVAIAILSCAVINQIIALKLSGAESPYYVGLILIIIVAIGLLPLNFHFAAALAMSIWLVYIVPILAFFNIPSMPDFISNNFYLLCAISITLTLRFISNRSFVNELSLQYELQNDKVRLDRLVQERTEALRKSEQWHRSIIENASDGILILNKNGVIANANDMASKIYHLSREQLIGMHAGDLFLADVKSNLVRMFNNMLRVKSIVLEMPYTGDIGKTVFLEISIQHIPISDEQYILMISRDITERKLFREQLAQNQKMNSIAAFSGGIAHDVRNIITSMIAYIDIVRNDKGVSERTLHRTNLLDKSILNAGNMITQLLSFARKSKTTLTESSLNDVVRDTLNIIRASIGDNIEILPNLWQKDLIIQANVPQIETVIMNLVFNARDAMPTGGRITITTETVPVANLEDMTPGNIADGKYAVLTIKDTGAGIPLEHQQRIFEPFFTTKDKDKGMGLGLAMVYSIVAEHKGRITVESEVDKGSLFNIYFPLVAERSSEYVGTEAAYKTATIIMPEKDNSIFPPESGTILFVDDDQALITMMSDALEARGYNVITTTNPEEAIAIVQKDAGIIDLLITDMAMPRIDGGELVQRIRSTRPNMKIIVISAFDRHKVEQMMDGVEVSATLHKPFAPTDFVTAVRTVLDDIVDSETTMSTQN
ncbi:MAG: hybrid sensor histidine kinase/response regulator [Nitrospirota bacterium]